MIPLNQQPVEKLDYREDGSLEIHSIFRTIQGEGPFAGTPAIFVRLSGCNLQCSFCDTEYTSNRNISTVDQILEPINETVSYTYWDSKLVVLTGGEPFRQNIAPLVNELCKNGYRVQIETNGTLYVPLKHKSQHRLVTIVCSPKTPRLNPDLERHVDAYKYIGCAGELDPRDGLPTVTMGMTTRVARPIPGKEVFLQPLDEGDEEKNKANTQTCLESCLKFGYRLSIQTHKLLGLP